jgi:hypothetical protein
MKFNPELINAEEVSDRRALVNFLSDYEFKKKKFSVYYKNVTRKLYLNTVLESQGLSNNKMSNSTFTLSNVNFLRKERLYTKLKYSRSPAYDIVSGGAAALLAGFVGFLISEKYGFELVDSGDFYYLFMYLVFIAFSFRPLLTSVNYERSLVSLLSPRYFLNFYLNLLYLILKLLTK